MAIKFLECGGSATGDRSLWDTEAGTVAIDTINTHGQTKSRKCTGATGANNRTSYNEKNVIGNTGRHDFGFTFDHLPSSFGATVAATLNRICTLTGTSSLALCLDASGTLHLVDTIGLANRATGSAVLSVNTHYRICICWNITSTTVNTIKVYVATGDGTGVLDISATNITIGSGTVTILRSGMTGWDCTSSAVNCWYTDEFIDDVGTGVDTGNIRCTPKRPVANGSLNDFTTQIGSGGSGYGTGHSPQVNERPLSETNGWSRVGTQANENYVIESASVGDVNITGYPIVDFMAWIRASSLVNETGIMYSGALNVNVALTNSSTTYIGIAGSTSYPVANQIGLQTDVTVTTVRLFECGIIIAYYGDPVAIVPPVLALTLTTFAPKLNLGIIPPVTALVLTEFAPKLNLGIVPPVTVLTLTEFAPNPGYGYVPTVINLLTTLFAPKMNLGIVPPVTNLVLTEYAPKLDLGIVPGVVNLLLTEYAPKLGLGIIPPLLALILTKFSPLLDLGIIPPTLALTLTEYAPKLGLTIIPGVLNLVLQFFGPRAEIDHPPISDFPFEGGVVVVARPPVGSAQFRK